MAKVCHIERTSRGADDAIDLDAMKRKSWPGIAAEFVRVASPAEFDFRLVNPASNYLVLLNLRRVDGETEVAGLPRMYKKDLRNKLTFIPSGCPVHGWSRISKPASFMGVYFNQTASDNCHSDPSPLPPIVEFEDNMLRSTMLQFQAILNDPSLDTPGYAETLGVLLAFEMERLKCQSKQPERLQGGLTARQVRLVTEHLESRLSDKTTISELSDLLNLSRFHFIRAFKKSVGMPPHQFVVHRRVERAKELLTDHKLSVSDVAVRTGFNSATQLTRTFRRVVGATPTTFRREIQ
jgi:AraC family transcriptional regulator